ncbi:unnamed protein product [Cyclocybe aegerita]|uniref:Magnesium transporter n=1 Tax=Cyclocybe aegerita TaxID=1973307 RepID=A0A8S0W6N6_CYCAE|nr:unnamed protein product [Cyclocybe aegerita]
MCYGHLHQQCSIEIVDYSTLRLQYSILTNEEFVSSMDVQRDPWVTVRWINIGAISWDVIKAVALKYDLHAQALEDVLKGKRWTRSTAHYYPGHLFIRSLCHQLEDDYYYGHIPDLNRSAPSPEYLDGPSEERLGNEIIGGSRAYVRRRKRPLLPTSRKDIRQRDMNSSESLDSSSRYLKEERNMNLSKPLSQKQESALFQALKYDRFVVVNVTQETVDASLLVHAMLDRVVGKALEVIDDYYARIKQCERDILFQSDMKTVRNLHILAGELVLHKRTLEPIKTLVDGLCKHDDNRIAILLHGSDYMANATEASTTGGGLISPTAKIYLADVHDHMDYILTSLDMFAGIAENLIDYAFNVAAYEANEVMRRLTLVTIIFLPLGVLTGYFGMNFKHFWSVNNNSDLFFWILALPTFVLTILVSLFSDMKKAVKYFRSAARRALLEVCYMSVYILEDDAQYVLSKKDTDGITET